MTYKERLENIDKRAKHKVLGNIEGEIKYRLTEINTKDYEWLIEQAERVQELEQQNERYKQALEFYANEETYETKFATDTDEIFDPFTLIELDEGKKAREALEGEE